MIQVSEMKPNEHMETNTPEQMQERYTEAERIVERHNAFIENHKAFMEKHEACVIQMKLHIQDIRARTPKQQIYFGKVKTE
jgi:predicted  nucleic acid-binding Zn-ribbon protein